MTRSEKVALAKELISAAVMKEISNPSDLIYSVLKAHGFELSSSNIGLVLQAGEDWLVNFDAQRKALTPNPDWKTEWSK